MSAAFAAVDSLSNVATTALVILFAALVIEILLVWHALREDRNDSTSDDTDR